MQLQIQPQSKNQTDVFCHLARKYREDPVFFVEHALGHMTWSKQRQILWSIRDHEKTAVRACHGSSKTFTAAEAVTWFLNCIPESKVITTAPTFSQIKNLLWAEINKIYTNSQVELIGECLTTEIKIKEDPNSYAIGFSTDKPSRAEGWHAPAILFIFDEAKGIEQWMWDSVRGLMTGGFCRFLAISTTDGVQVGENYYDIFKSDKKGWNKIHISALDCPHITGEALHYLWIQDKKHPESYEKKLISPKKVNIQIANQRYIDDCKEEWGEDSVLFQSKVYGELIDIAADTVIKLSQVNKMFANSDDASFDDSGVREIGVDVARSGADDTVFIMRKGLKVLRIRAITKAQMQTKKDLTRVADELCTFAEYDKKCLVKIDDTGVGGGLTDIMKRRGYAIMPVNFGESASEPQKDNYPDIISEMWFQVAPNIDKIACPNDPRLQKELINRKYTIDKKGRRKIESKSDYKKRGFQSPDMADAFLLAFFQRQQKKSAVYITKSPWN